MKPKSVIYSVLIFSAIIGFVGGLVFSILYGVDKYAYDNYGIAKCDITSNQFVRDTCRSCDSNNKCHYYDCSYFVMYVDVFEYSAQNNMTGNMYIKAGRFTRDFPIDRTYGNLFPCWYDLSEREDTVRLTETDDPTWMLVMLIIGWVVFVIGLAGAILFFVKDVSI